MRLEEIYLEDRANYYLGLVSGINHRQISVQVENLSILTPHIISGNSVIPNTIDFYVVVDSAKGIFIANVYQSALKNSDKVHLALNDGIVEGILPDIQLELLSFAPKFENYFEASGFNTVGLGDKVYIGNSKIVTKYLLSLQLEKDEENIAKFSTLSKFPNIDFELGINNLFNRHLMAIGTTGSGKSTSSLAILEKVIDKNKKVMIIDPTGEYEETFCKNSNIERLTLGLDTCIRTGQLSLAQWAILFNTNSNTQAPVLSEAIAALRYQKNVVQQTTKYTKIGKTPKDVETEISKLDFQLHLDFDIKLLPSQIAEDSVDIDGGYNSPTKGKFVQSAFKANQNQFFIDKVNYKLKNSNFVALFSNDESKCDLINEIDKFLLEKSKSLYINASNIDSDDGAGGMVVDLISLYLLNHANRNNPFILFVDEAHRYTRNLISDTNEFYTGLTSLAREGRKNGQYLFLTTQNPKDVDKILLGQMGTLLVHRLTHQDEIHAISNFLNESVLSKIQKLRRGEVVLSSVNLLQDIYLTMIPSKLTHKNDSPKL